MLLVLVFPPPPSLSDALLLFRLCRLGWFRNWLSWWNRCSQNKFCLWTKSACFDMKSWSVGKVSSQPLLCVCSFEMPAKISLSSSAGIFNSEDTLVRSTYWCFVNKYSWKFILKKFFFCEYFRVLQCNLGPCTSIRLVRHWWLKMCCLDTTLQIWSPNFLITITIHNLLIKSSETYL